MLYGTFWWIELILSSIVKHKDLDSGIGIIL